MNSQITELSVYADGILKQYSMGTVHSVYRKTINLSLGEKLLALQPSGTSRSPISLLTELPTDIFETLAFRAGDEIRIEKDGLCGAQVRFFTGNALLKENRISEALLPERCLEIGKHLHRLLCREQTGVFCQIMSGQSGEETEVLVRASKQCLEEAKTRIQNKRWEQAAECLCRLVGLGIGLTPGGDDFLCGMLAGMEMGKQKDHPLAEALRRQIVQNLYRTNDISRAFLACALEGQYGQLVLDFYVKSTEEILLEAKKIGHSSGMDTLCGIVYFFEQQKYLRMPYASCPRYAGRKMQG